MKISKIINELHKLIEKHGDVDVHIDIFSREDEDVELICDLCEDSSSASPTL